MKFAIGVKKFKEAVERACSMAAPPGATIGAFSHVLIEAGKDSLGITGMRLDAGARVEAVPDGVMRPGKCAVPAKTFGQAVASLPNSATAEVSFDGTEVTVNAAAVKFSMPVYPAEDYPLPYAPLSDGEGCVIGCQEFIGALSRVAFAASNEKDTARPMMAGVLIEAQGDSLRLAATDGKRLAVNKVRLEAAAAAPASCVVPVKGLAPLMKFLGDSSGYMTFRVTASKFFVKVAGLEYWATILNGQFPNFGRIIPKTHERYVSVGADEFAAALKRACITAQDRDSPYKVRLSISKDTLTIVSATAGYGSAMEVITCTATGEPLNVYFNAQFFLQPLASYEDAKNVELLLTDERKACLMRPDNYEQYLEYAYVLMPVRTKEA